MTVLQYLYAIYGEKQRIGLFIDIVSSLCVCVHVWWEIRKEDYLWHCYNITKGMLYRMLG